MISDFAMKGKKNIFYLFKKIKYDFNFFKENPGYFSPDGLVVFCGAQGSGKTLSAVNYVYNLMTMYPKCKLVTNVDLKHFPVVDFNNYKLNYFDYEKYGTNLTDKEIYEIYLKENRVFRFTNALDFEKYNNDKYGVIFLVDEIHLYLNSLKSRNINLDVITQISQQRKQRKHIVATCQVFGRMAKPLREQFSNVVLCKSYFNFVQKNMLIDRDSIDSEESTGTNISGKVKRNYIYFRHPKMFERYDTYAIIENSDLAYTRENQDIYDIGGVKNGNKLSNNS